MTSGTALEVGTLAPDFTLKNQFGEDVTLSDLRGSKVVVMFYPFAFTGICTGELCEIRDRRADFDAGDAIVLSISCDPTPALKAFAEAEGLNHTLLSDFWPHGEVSRAYGAFWEQTGFATRATYVLDRDGVIRWSVVNGPGEPRDAADYTQALATID
ncbi:MAG: peroxiredoxin [Actinomycetota bacterium]|nr:peroxiredoxin [Actinomycetota bacterium]